MQKVWIEYLHRLSSTVQQLEHQIRALSKRVDELEALSNNTTQIAEQPPAPEDQQKAPASAPPVPDFNQVQAPLEPPAAPIQTQPGDQRKSSRTKEEWEALIGGKLLNRIGALALTIGFGFFLKYAFDQDWITEPLRVIIGVVTGILLLFTAARSARKGLQVFAQGLVGAGIAILYLSAYASFNFYSLVSQPVAFLLMSAVTVVAFSQAFRYDALAVSLLGLLGGFLTPFLLSTGEVNPLGLFGYIVLLDVGILIVSLRKDAWIILEPLTLGGTYTIFLLWWQNHYTTSDLAIALAFPTLIWLMFHALDVQRLLRRVGTSDEMQRLVSVSNGFLYFFVLFLIINPESTEGFSGASFLLGLAYFVTALATRRGQSWTETHTAQYTLTALVLLATATWIQFEDFTLAILWTVEGLAIFTLGVRRGIPYIWKTAFAIQVLAFGALLFSRATFFFFPIEDYTPLFNMRAAAFAALSLTLVLGSFVLRTSGNNQYPRLSEGMHYASLILLAGLLTVETNDLFRMMMIGESEPLQEHLSFLRVISIAAVWTTLALLLVWAGIRTNFKSTLYTGLWLLLLGACLGAIRGVAYSPIEQFQPILNDRALVLILILVSTIIVLLLLSYRRVVFEWLPELGMALRIAIVVLILTLITGEIRDYFENAKFQIQHNLSLTDGAGELEQLENLKQLALSIAWLLISIALMAFGLWKRVRVVRVEAIVVFGFAILKIFIYDLSFLGTLYRIFSFLGLGLILLAVSYLYQKYKTVILEPSTSDSSGHSPSQLPVKE
ncbi:MAG: DUF2339 domain-containing protein [Bacteroidetes bacterium]|nr:DUF2339 domain-containing protein [Bacteroidota bacterium]